MFHDEVSGDIVCLGPNSLGCGMVLNEHMISNHETVKNLSFDGNMFSEMNTMKHHLSDGYNSLQRLNEVEKSLSSHIATNLITRQSYKDDQRSSVYETINNIGVMCDVSRHIQSKGFVP
mmetsp:Transcript_7691/g.10246  ORF Transcript_7691/g.10246 Transcript_7691/m.10246 type:complete len:119 (+) Transcript_7691:269-625(+)